MATDTDLTPTEAVEAFDLLAELDTEHVSAAMHRILSGPVEEIPTVESALKNAGQPMHVNTAAILDRDTVFVAWRPQQAILRNTGEISSGYFCLVRDVLSGGLYTVFIGGIALCRVLSKINPPFRATITVSGRTLVFASQPGEAA